MRPSNQSRESGPPIRLPDRDGAPHARGVVALLGLRFGRFGAPPPAPERTTQTPCRHTHHVGTCPACQRERLERWQEQLDQAHDTAPTSGQEPQT